QTTPEILKLSEVEECVFRIGEFKTGFSKTAVMTLDARKGLNWRVPQGYRNGIVTVLPIETNGDVGYRGMDGYPFPATFAVATHGGQFNYNQDLRELRTRCTPT